MIRFCVYDYVLIRLQRYTFFFTYSCFLVFYCFASTFGIEEIQTHETFNHCFAFFWSGFMLFNVVFERNLFFVMKM